MHIVIISPVPVVRAGLRSMLAASLVDSTWDLDPDPSLVISDAASLVQALDILEDVDVLIWAGGGLPILELHQTVRHQAGKLAILALVDDPLLVQGISDLALRAWGMLPMDCTEDELGVAVKALAEGLLVGTPALVRQVLKPRHQTQPILGSDLNTQESNTPLTERELEILQLIAQGLANKQIAARLAISEHTVKFHVSSIYAKLNATNRTEAVRMGIQAGLILF